MTSRLNELLIPVAFDHNEALARDMLKSLFDVPQVIVIESIEIVKPVSAFQMSM